MPGPGGELARLIVAQLFLNAGGPLLRPLPPETYRKTSFSL